MSTMCKLVFFLLNNIYRYCWGTLVIQITLLKGYVLQSTSPLKGRNGLLCNHNSFKNQWLLFPNRFSLHWGLRDSCIILNVSKRNKNSRNFIALKVIIQFFSIVITTPQSMKMFNIKLQATQTSTARQISNIYIPISLIGTFDLSVYSASSLKQYLELNFYSARKLKQHFELHVNSASSLK